jgi:hypothetical protein
MTESCPNGCTVMPTGVDDVCASAGSMCSAGVTPEWTCNAARTARVRCEAGRDRSESCPFGCRVNGGEDTCIAAPTCPAGSTPDWTCASDGRSRARCLMGAEQREECANGCEARVGEDVCGASPLDAGPAPRDAQSEGTPVDSGALVAQDAQGAVPPVDASGVGMTVDAGGRDGGRGRRDDAARLDPGALEGGCACRAAAPASESSARILPRFAALVAFALGRRRRPTTATR